MWFSVVCSLIDEYALSQWSKFCGLKTRRRVTRPEFWPPWWLVPLLIIVQTTLNHISICFFYHNINSKKTFFSFRTPGKKGIEPRWCQQRGMDSHRQRKIANQISRLAAIEVKPNFLPKQLKNISLGVAQAYNREYCPWRKYQPLVSSFVVLTVTNSFSMDSSTGMLYRLSAAPPTLRFFLPDMFEPMLMTLVPSSTPPVNPSSFSSSQWSFNKIACPDVNSASSLNAGWRFLGSPPAYPWELQKPKIKVTRKV